MIKAALILIASEGKKLPEVGDSVNKYNDSHLHCFTLLTVLFLFWVVHFPPSKYEEAILYPMTQGKHVNQGVKSNITEEQVRI